MPRRQISAAMEAASPRVQTAASWDQWGVVWRGQFYAFDGVRSHTNKDGGATELAAWQSRCAECNAPITVLAARMPIEELQLTRRCERHRKPGARAPWPERITL